MDRFGEALCRHYERAEITAVLIGLLTGLPLAYALVEFCASRPDNPLLYTWTLLGTLTGVACAAALNMRAKLAQDIKQLVYLLLVGLALSFLTSFVVLTVVPAAIQIFQHFVTGQLTLPSRTAT